jgi:hypothetical protein
MEHFVYGFVTRATLARLGGPSSLDQLQIVADGGGGRDAVRRLAYAVKAAAEAAGHRVTGVDVPVPRASRPRGADRLPALHARRLRPARAGAQRPAGDESRRRDARRAGARDRRDEDSRRRRRTDRSDVPGGGVRARSRRLRHRVAGGGRHGPCLRAVRRRSAQLRPRGRHPLPRRDLAPARGGSAAAGRCRGRAGGERLPDLGRRGAA